MTEYFPGMTRRTFMKGALAAGVTAAIPAPGLLKNVFAAGPSRGGALKLGLAGGSTTDSLDPSNFSGVFDQMTTMGLYRNPFLELDKNGELQPELVKEWNAEPGAKIWHFKLRNDVEFHNGKTMDAEDALFSINHHRGEGNKSQIAAVVKPIKEVVKTGKFEFKVILDAPNADFPYILSSTRLPCVPAGTTNFEDGMGTGGYVLKEWEPGVRAFGERNPNYFKEDRAWFDSIEIITMADDTARTTALKTGQVHIINRPDRKTARLLGRMKGIQVINTPGGLTYTFPMRKDVKPYDNADFRKAVKYSVDRDALVKTILQGYGVPGNDYPVPSFVKYAATDIPQRQYDPDKVKFHLKKSGLQDEVVRLHVADMVYNGCVDTAQLWKEHATKAGMKMEVVKEANDGYWAKVWRVKPFCASFWYARPTVDWILSMTYVTEASANESNWKVPSFDKLVKEARAELNPDKRRQMYYELQKTLHDDGSVVIPMIANIVDAASDKIGFNPVAGNVELDGLRACERWWFKA
ncbi:MAG: ABC transporter substrate-binding protein [Desulfobacterales bacterium]|nr:ABC transporter substrate-binding protein [Desulfobacterales bacterium]